MKVHFIHGIHASRKPATRQLAYFFRELGFDVVVHSYGWALALPRLFGDWLNERRAKAIAKTIRDGDVVVAHSNGCTIAHMIQKSHRRLFAAILMQPALDNDVAFTGTDRVLVVFNEKDNVVEHSRLARFSSWGNMGRVGYKGEATNVEQWDALAPPNSLPPYSGHCGFVETGPVLLRQWGVALASWLWNKREAP